MRKEYKRVLLLSLLWLVTAACSAQEISQTNAQPLSKPPVYSIKAIALLNEEIVTLRVSNNQKAVDVEATLYKPDGAGPFPLLIVNHWTSWKPGSLNRPRYFTVAGEFVARGYMVVIPMRRGICDVAKSCIVLDCDLQSHWSGQAQDVKASISELVKRTDVDPTRIVVVGHAEGGLATVALGALAVSGVRGLINFEGGVGARYSFPACDSEKSMLDAFGEYARKTTTPSLWFYRDNNELFWRDLPKLLHQRYNGEGGKAKLTYFGMNSGPYTVLDSSGYEMKMWVEPVEEFLRSINMPATVLDKRLNSPRLWEQYIDRTPK